MGSELESGVRLRGKAFDLRKILYIPYHADHEVGDILGVDGASRFVLLERAWVGDVIFRGVG